MKILFLAHMWCPIHNAGGETTVHAACRDLVRRGHDVQVLCRTRSDELESNFAPYEFEGVRVEKVRPYQDQEWIREYARTYDPDLLVTHLDLTTAAMQLSLDIRKPLAHFIHNTMSIRVFRVTPEKCQLPIFNSHWVAEHEQWPGPQVVIHPIVEPERYRCERGTKITLVNPTPNKGAITFYDVSKLLPHREFLCVKSIYGEQVAPPNLNPDLHPNVETMEHTPDIREAFRKTKVLMMPSDYESYGRVAVEAACCGIPTIAHPTPGLVEALGEAGIFHDRDDKHAWAEEIERLFTDEVYYRKRSDLALKLADSLDPESEFERLEKALMETVERWQLKEEYAMNRVVTSNRRLGKTADGRLTDNMREAISLVCGGPGDPIPEEMEEQAKQLGFTDTPSEKREVLLDTKALTAPPENKAIPAPEQTKTRKKKTA